MATNILMPALSPTMTEGTLARWLKREGERVAAGDVIAEIETDKATMEVEAVDEGVLGRILVPDGTANVAVNAPIAILIDAGESLEGAHAAAAPTEAARKEAARKEAARKEAAPMEAAPAVEEAAPAAAAPAAPVAASVAAGDRRIVASPLARRLAQAAGIDLGSLRGSGPNGRIVRADVDARLSKPAAAVAAAPVAASAPVAAPAPAAAPVGAAGAPVGAAGAPVGAAGAEIDAPHRLVKHSTMRRVIARRLTEAKQTVPHFYLSVDIALDALLALRGELNKRGAAGAAPYKLSVNDLIIKAAAVALRQVPEVNASYTEQGTVLYDDVDISVAVSIPDGLITPIIRQADRKGLVAISAEMRDLAARAKAGKLKPHEYQGGGFSISNLGMFGISNFSAVINPPQGAILAVGAGEQRAVVRDGALAVATMMTCTMSVDHRVIDGALGAQWLQSFKALIEDPLGILL